jgi:hypothetical protein
VFLLSFKSWRWQNEPYDYRLIRLILDLPIARVLLSSQKTQEEIMMWCLNCHLALELVLMLGNFEHDWVVALGYSVKETVMSLKSNSLKHMTQVHQLQCHITTINSWKSN